MTIYFTSISLCHTEVHLYARPQSLQGYIMSVALLGPEDEGAAVETVSNC